MSETLESKIARLNRYHERRQIRRFDRLYTPLCEQVTRAGKHLHYEDGQYHLAGGAPVAVELPALPDWLTGILSE